MLSVVIPTYNRGQHLKDVCQSLSTYLEGLVSVYEIIIVDDGCVDHTSKVMKELCLTNPRIHGLVLDANYGQQNASLAGIRYANYDMVLTMDDDLRYGLSGIGLLLDAMKEGWDVVYGIPLEAKAYGFRAFGTTFKELAFRLFCHKPKGVKLTSFRLMNKDVVAYVKEDDNTKVYISAKILQYTRHITNIDVEVDGAMSLPSNYSIARLLSVLGQVFMNYTRLGQLFSKDNNKKQYNIKEIY